MHGYAALTQIYCIATSIRGGVEDPTFEAKTKHTIFQKIMIGKFSVIFKCKSVQNIAFS